jgi:hypothetical protein
VKKRDILGTSESIGSEKVRGRYETSKVCFLIVSFTASYAASKKQPIFSGCFLEWRLANYNRQGAVNDNES